MSRSGARQWRVPCLECGPRKESTDKRMHSQVSSANAGYFITEDRLAADLSERQLRNRLEQADGALVVCNNCGHIREAGA